MFLEDEKMVEKLVAYRWKRGCLEAVEDLLAEEGLLNVIINKKIGFKTVITPENIKEFVYGNLFSEGLIKVVTEIKEYVERKRKNVIEVEIALDSSELQSRNYSAIWNYNILASDCTSAVPEYFEEGVTKVEHTFKLEAIKLIDTQAKIKDSIELFKTTGAFHYAFLFTPALELEFGVYDISRHNAIDKVIGKALLEEIDLRNRILFTTGRITSSAVLKCLRAKIPFIISRGACLLNAVKLARTYDLGVIGFLRGNRFNIYSGENYVI